MKPSPPERYFMYDPDEAPWPNWSEEIGPVGDVLTVLILGDRRYPDKGGATRELLKLIADTRHHHPDAAIRLIVSSVTGSIMTWVTTSDRATWPQLMAAAGADRLTLDLVENPAACKPDLVIMFWDQRAYVLPAIKLAHGAVYAGIPVRCLKWSGTETFGPTSLPSLPAAYAQEALPTFGREQAFSRPPARTCRPATGFPR